MAGSPTRGGVVEPGGMHSDGRTRRACEGSAEAVLGGMARTHLEELRRMQPALVGLVERFGRDGPRDDTAVRDDR